LLQAVGGTALAAAKIVAGRIETDAFDLALQLALELQPEFGWYRHRQFGTDEVFHLGMRRP